MCVWCRDPNADESHVGNPETDLCRPHWAEYEGGSLAGLDRMLAAERADMTDMGYFDR